ncbi:MULTISPECIES: HAD family hydrolase [unclassified Bradyrhizobium]|uniref:HAD family hydrolase n=1 Tax=unclassified Bradyrhizobium TaxID=2631580 RepID=UPI0029163C6D|nr:MULTISPECIES: HAD hydrolase-like protein [unclassified Bradyrhizobium]
MVGTRRLMAALCPPYLLLQALDATAAKAEQAVFIGDTSFDMEMAQAAKLRGIGVTWGYHTAERLSAAGAQRIVRSVEELRSLLSVPLG